MPRPKKPSSSRKKKANRNKVKQRLNASSTATPVNPPDINEVLSQAELALETSNIENAMKLYGYAVGVLRNNLQTNVAATSEEKEENMLQLSKVLGKVAEMKVSNGDQQGGQEAFMEATALLSGEGPNSESGNKVARAQWKEARASLYLYLGQLSSSNDALQTFTRAITDLKECVTLLEDTHPPVSNNGNVGAPAPAAASMAMEDDAGENNLQTALVETRRQLCGAYCSVAELFLTDLCFEANAEKDCESALQAALELDDPKSSPDAVQAMANLRISQNRGIEAVSYILDAYSRVKVGCEAMADLVGLGIDDGDDKKGMVDQEEDLAKELKGEELDAANSLPGFEFRCQMGKLLLECASILDEEISSDAEKRAEQRKFCVEAAIQVFGSLLAENDEVIEVWFLLGCAFSSTKSVDVETSKHYFENSLEMLEKVKKGMEQESTSMEMMNQVNEEVKSSMADIDEKIKEVKNRLDGLGSTNDSAMEED